MKRTENIPEAVRLLGTFVSTFLTTIVVIVALFLVVTRATGCSLFTIESASMSPAYPVGSVVLVVPTDFEDIEAGDVVTYVLDESGTLVTHRVVSVNAQARTLTTKGDANDAVDARAVIAENVVGKVVLCVPGVGVVLKALGAEENRAIVIGCTTVVFVGSIAVDVVGRLRRRRFEGGRKGGAHARQGGRHARKAAEQGGRHARKAAERGAD